MSKAFLAQIG